MVRPELWHEYEPGQRVMTREGVAGRVDDVLDGPGPGNETYLVTLDAGLGGGEYAAGELAPLTETTAAVETAASHYPELGTILTDRPPPAASVPAEDYLAGRTASLAERLLAEAVCPPVEAGWVRDLFQTPSAEHSYDWCRFRRDSHCWYPKSLDGAATRQAGYAVWTPADRGRCPRGTWALQERCPLGQPGPNAGGYTDATTMETQQGGVPA